MYQPKQITKKAYNNIIKSIQERIKMDTIFMNSENSKTSEPHILVLKLNNNLDLRISEKNVTLSIKLSQIHIW